MRLEKGITKQNGMSLIGVFIVFSLVGFLMISALLYMRFGQSPVQYVIGKFSKTAAEVTSNVNINPSINPSVNPSVNPLSNSKDFDGAIKSCKINGKTVYSNVECENAPNSKAMKLHDSKGFEAPKVPVVASEPAATGGLDISSKIAENMKAK
jgi:hypothetical protein